MLPKRYDMTIRVVARSISRPVREHLRRRPTPPLRVVAVFERACNLVSCDEEDSGFWVALVSSEVGTGRSTWYLGAAASISRRSKRESSP
jgi:hypothetical protein